MLRNQEMLVTAARTLKERSIKNTPQRQVILAYLMNSKAHPSIEMIHQHVQESGFSVSLATVYNTLELFLKNKLIIEVTPDSEGHMRYDYFERPHYHVICVNCNKIVDVYNDTFTELEKEAAQTTGYQVYNSQYEVYGLCPDCQKKLVADS
ncbi:Fur family transcriptional regulator [Ligilactobacillus agilis]|jgi:Fur family transcriptional regulator, peroxide stress response regulator|uniref:Ferric uptake regulation protein n=2 Tax=Ligilactobacillus agilis TaxID=1601 RepID=A0A0R2AGS2_9LACO|nr:transcriptional repressor [Ligilactobacillus agilis]ASR41382.1 transcriptional repressor [Ligilactobacillus agilis]KRM64852.1 ferric uptake regulation protein [Ligilactobacillus agilis DSM 20509]MBL1056668.1 transcriptional repressor [Ligilactobacillus agilis]MBM6764237.1 transcriptional repressor [Ligilactobacillus agilis]MBM6773794.1 transcriptional repressor [Ligilactobacillus agilis]